MGQKSSDRLAQIATGMHPPIYYCNVYLFSTNQYYGVPTPTDASAYFGWSFLTFAVP